LPTAYRFIFIFLITLTFGFGGGYFFGFYRHRAGVEKELHLATVALDGSKNFLSNEQLIYLFEVHNLKVHLHSLQDLDQPIDLYFVSSQQLDKYLGAPLLPDFSSSLSADFQKIAIDPRQFLPIAWKILKTENEKPLLRSYFFVRSPTAKDDVLNLFFDLFFNPNFYMHWIENTDLASTLAFSESFPEQLSSKKASQFRRVPLVDLLVESQKTD
jgi:hypothetical protein